MAVFTHTDYKIVCDNCCKDMTDYYPAKNKTHAVEIARVQTGKPLKRGSHFCEDCEDPDTRPPRYDAPPMNAFENAKTTNINEIRELGLIKSIN